MHKDIRGDAVDLSGIDLGDIASFDIEIFNVNDSAAIPEGGASTGSWSCGGGGYSCSCSWHREREWDV